jgi:hypothetical protein
MEQMQNNEVVMTDNLSVRYTVKSNQWVYMNLGCAKKIAGGIIAFNLIPFLNETQMEY